MLYNVLIVEDDRQTADSLAAQVGVLGHTVAIAYGPRMAIQHLNQVIPDVIFLDVNMPGVNGLEVLRFLRRDPMTAKVPVVIISAEEVDSIRQQAFEAGANHYLVKPPTLEDIESAIKDVMTKCPPPGLPGIQPVAGQEVTPGAQAEAGPDAESGPKPEDKPTVKPDAKPKSKSKAKRSTG
ncbi:MAG: response regulator [Anaerolineae bacterium]|jgi:chemotaxis family two-component system response regulator PixH|nr:response regulator [Anaerolineae bacterium]